MRRQQQRLGHRCRVEIEQVRVEDQQRGARRTRRYAIPSREESAAPPRSVVMARQAIDTSDAKSAGAIEQIDLHRQQLDQVRQRQPDRADLLPSRRQVVEDAARDDQVRLRVVMAENEAGCGRRRSTRRRRRVRRRRRAAGEAARRAPCRAI